jgi:hypothetical protein
VQEVLLIPSGRALEIPTACHVALCPHIGIVAQAYEALLPESAQCTIDHSHDLKWCIRQSGLKHCNYCPTQYQIDLQECGQLGVAAVIQSG